MRKHTPALVIACLIGIALTACSASPTATDTAASSPQKAQMASYGASSSNMAADPSYEAAADMDPLERPAAEPETGTPGDVSEFDRKLVRNAWLVMEADDCRAAYDQILSRAIAMGGYEAGHEINAREASVSVSATIKVPPQNLDEFLRLAGDAGKIISSSTQSDDITENYYDAEIRLTTRKKSLEQYYLLLQKATSVEEIIAVQRTIDQLTEEIESLEGRLRLYDTRVSMATVTLTLYGTDKTPATVEWNSLSTQDLGAMIRKGFIGTINFFWSLIQWLLIIIATISPLLVIAGILLLVNRKRIRAWREKRKAWRSQAQQRLETLKGGSSDAFKTGVAVNTGVQGGKNGTVDPNKPDGADTDKGN